MSSDSILVKWPGEWNEKSRKELYDDLKRMQGTRIIKCTHCSKRYLVTRRVTVGFIHDDPRPVMLQRTVFPCGHWWGYEVPLYEVTEVQDYHASKVAG